MEFGREKCAMIMRNGKKKITEGTELPNQERIRKLGEKETYKNLWNIRSGNNLTRLDKQKINE